MKKILQNFLTGFLPRLLKDDRGQSTTEYILILSVVVMVALKFKKQFSGTMDKMMGDLNGKLDGALKDETP